LKASDFQCTASTYSLLVYLGQNKQGEAPGDLIL
jgi:hypothetical protein